MSEPLPNLLSKLLEAENASDRLEKIPKELYREAAAHIKSLRNNISKEGEDVVSRLAARERELTAALAQRLLEVRIKKASQMVEGGEDSNLTPEEKYILDPLSLSLRRMEKVKRAVWNGQTAILRSTQEKVLSKYVVVRFLQPTPATVGADLKTYGPFEKEDVALLPAENMKPLIKQGIVVELWDID